VREVLDRLRRAGLTRIVMLTGDHGAVGDAIGKEVGVDEVRGELLPEDKSRRSRSYCAIMGASRWSAMGSTTPPRSLRQPSALRWERRAPPRHSRQPMSRSWPTT
jgi:magnesium-transporting ATPase (P-type)